MSRWKVRVSIGNPFSPSSEGPFELEIAIALKIPVAIYHMFSQQVSYHDWGDLYLDRRNKNHLTRNLIHRLERLVFAVTLTPHQKAA